MQNPINKPASKRRERGLTLIEAAMVLALSAVVVAGAVMYYQSASENNKTQAALAELGMIQSAVQTLTGASANYADLTTADLLKSSNIPSSQKNDKDILSPWGTVAVAVDPKAANNYTVTLDAVPQSSCLAMAQDLGNSVVSLAIGGKALTDYKRATVAAACADKNNNSMVWTFK